MKVEDSRLGDVMEINLKLRAAYAILGLPQPPSVQDPDQAPAPIPAEVERVMGLIENITFTVGEKSGLTKAETVTTRAFTVSGWSSRLELAARV